MTSPIILVIDDSATIRKLVDSHLSQEGYRVYLAPTAEKGLELAREVRPDLILLDHQLPGTTGLEVCRKIIQFPECSHVPFVVSSTLRKQAYAEYMEVPNVVDSLHKPFQPELLKMTVANALETGAMIVSSQTQGTAVPEILGEADKSSLTGDFQFFGLRELLDFLTNSNKRGLLEAESEHDRFGFYLDGGQIQAVVSASVNPETVARDLPEAIHELAPLLRFTMCTGFSAQVDGLVDLMDKKVLDPRLFRSLLRHQAAVLTRLCFHSPLKTFSFAAERALPPLFRKTALSTGLAAMLVEGTLVCPAEDLPVEPPQTGWVRKVVRGQNLDRTGLLPRHVQVLSAVESTPCSTDDLARRVNVPGQEVRRILAGLHQADWIQLQSMVRKRQVVALEPDMKGSHVLRQVLTDDSSPWSGKVVRDQFGLQLLLKRMQPDVVLISSEFTEVIETAVQADVLCLIANAHDALLCEDQLAVLRRPYSASDVLNTLDRALAQRESASTRPGTDEVQFETTLAESR